jgi:hypothetical protein
MNSIARGGGGAAGFSADAFRRDYIALLTTPGAHDDAYAGTCHRM